MYDLRITDLQQLRKQRLLNLITDFDITVESNKCGYVLASEVPCGDTPQISCAGAINRVEILFPNINIEV